MVRRSFIGLVTAAFVMALFMTPAIAKDAYKIGISMAITGPGAGTYGPMKDAIDIYFKAVNAEGGINGHPVSIIFEDNAAQPSKAAAQAKKLAAANKAVSAVSKTISKFAKFSSNFRLRKP